MELVYKRSQKNKLLVVCSLLITLLMASFCYYYFKKSPIIDFNNSPEQVTFLQTLFKDNMYLLVSEDSDFSLDFMLKHKVSHVYEPAMPIHTMKLYQDPDGKLAGFTTYYHPYMHQRGHALILFLVIDKEFRNKGYGKKMLEYVIKELKKEGCTSAELAVRVENFEAQKLYKKLGFYEYWRDDKFMRMRRLLI